jgi:hypothetical protein
LRTKNRLCKFIGKIQLLYDFKGLKKGLFQSLLVFLEDLGKSLNKSFARSFKSAIYALLGGNFLLNCGNFAEFCGFFYFPRGGLANRLDLCYE